MSENLNSNEEKIDPNDIEISAIYFQNGGHAIALSGSPQKGIIKLDGEINCVVLMKIGSLKHPFLFPESLPRNKKNLTKLGFTIIEDEIDEKFWKN